MSEVCDRCRRTLVAGDSPPLCSTCRRDQYEAYVRQGLVPTTTAYDRAQAELLDSARSAVARVLVLDQRLDAALRRIEALELEVVRLKQSALNPMMVLQVPPLATHLGCGCEGPFCKGHAFSGGVTRCTLPDEGT